jgi:subtilisin family serine protease
MDYFGHGTAVASIAAGVAPGAKLYAYQVMLYDNLQQSTYDSNVIRAIDVALDPNQDGNLSDHVDIISLSGGDRNGNPYDALSTAANNAVDAGAVFVVAAGNYGGEYIPSPNSKYTGPNYGTISSPGCAEKVITVGSVDQNDHISFFSSRGPIAGVTYTKPDIVAPGQGNKPSCANYCPPNSGLCVAKSNIFNMNYIIDCPNHPGYFTGFGTSFSTPHVSGVAALLLQKNPNWTPAQVKEAIKKTAIHLQNYSVNDQGSGRVDALAAIKLCNDMTPNAQCSVSKPNYCNSGVLINNCKTCGCPNLYSCTSTGSCTKSIVSVQATSK